MEPCLENIFQKYLITDLNSRSYAKNLTKLITFFISKERFLEARFYLDQLEKTHSGNIISIRLGYKLAIAIFDHKRVIYYDKLLFSKRKDDFELEWYRLQYYYSVNNISQIINSAKFLLLKHNLKREYMESILQVTWNIQNYELSVMVHKYAMKQRLQLTSQMDKLIRSIVIERLRDSLAKYKNV